MKYVKVHQEYLLYDNFDGELHNMINPETYYVVHEDELDKFLELFRVKSLEELDQYDLMRYKNIRPEENFNTYIPVSRQDHSVFENAENNFENPVDYMKEHRVPRHFIEHYRSVRDHDNYCVYHLISNDEVFYVGMSSNLKKRIAYHIKDAMNVGVVRVSCTAAQRIRLLIEQEEWFEIRLASLHETKEEALEQEKLDIRYHHKTVTNIKDNIYVDVY